MATQMNDAVAHKSDLDALEERIITRVKAEIAAEISRAKFEMLTWGIGILLLNDGLILAGIKLFI